MQYTNSASGDDLMMLPTDMVCAFFFESREARAPELERRPWRAVSLVSFRTRGGGKKREGKTQRGEEEKLGLDLDLATSTHDEENKKN